MTAGLAPILDAVDEATGGSGLFSLLDAEGRRAVEAEVEWVRLEAGGILFGQSDPGDSMFVVITGRLHAIVDTPDGPPQVVGEIRRGESVGEMAVLTGDRRSATIRAVRDTTLVRFSQDAFERIVASNPKAMLAITRRIIQRLQQRNVSATAVSHASTIAVLSVDGSDRHRGIAESLVAALEPFGSCRALTAATLADEVPAEAARSQWLDDQERRHDYTLYVADESPSPWTALSVRQADRILLVAAADERLDPAAIQRRLAECGIAGRPTPIELVLLQPADRRTPRDTDAWLSATGASSHHHVRRGEHGDMARLARVTTGRAVGLVLGGGGARGFAHLGVIRALREAGVPIDAIGGTSMGAVIAAQYAMGLDDVALRDLNHRTWIGANPLKDKTLPVVALLACRRLDRMVASMFGDTDIADLWLPYFCVTTDLTRAEVRVHRRGRLDRAVRASMSLPGMAIPVCDGASMLVDGGVLNNVPADVMKGVCRGRVIAVDVSPDKDLTVTQPFPSAASGWQLLASRRGDLPNILAIIMRTTLLTSAQRRQQVAHDIDLEIKPAVGRFGMFEWHSLDDIAAAGYEAAGAALRAWSPA